MTIEEYCQLFPWLEKITLVERDLDKVIRYYDNVIKGYFDIALNNI